MRLYLAYGSNLNRKGMRRRCPDARPVGKVMLTNARLVFRGVADIEYAPGDSKVPCGIWSISPDDERELDRYEGVSSGMYYKEYGVKIRFRGEEHNPLLYLMKSEGIYPPSAYYVAAIRQGYQDFGLDESFLDDAVEASFNEKSPDRQTVARRVRQRQDFRHQKLVEMPESVALRRRALLNE